MMDDMDDLVQFLRARLDEDELWAIEASRRDGSQAHPGGVHWQWVNPETDTPVKAEPSRGPFLTDEAESYRFSLRSMEMFPTNGVGPLPQFAVHTAEDVPAAAAGHIVRHDPARVLAEVGSKRQILELHAESSGLFCAHCEHEPPCPTLRLLVLPYADHPDYRDTWRP